MIKATGSFLSNLFFGEVKILDWLVPWSITIDPQLELVTISKRNYYLIGVDHNVIPFRNIRQVLFNSHLFGADISLKVYGAGKVTAKCLKKREAKKVYQLCLDEITSNSKGSSKTRIYQ
jgi:hypothetical protein